MFIHALVCVISHLAMGQVVSAADDPFWIVRHGPLTAGRLDSIISPGGVAGHVHAILGGSNFGPEYDYATSLESNCTTANVKVDHTNYWAPDLYRKQSDGGVKHIGLSYANTYYFEASPSVDQADEFAQVRQPNEPINEFPPGFRMMAGSAKRTTHNATDKSNAAINFVCLGNGGPENPGFPDKPCPDGVRAQAFFPNCWDGKHNWLEGNKHMSYPAEGEYNGGGKCPSTHPKRMASVFYEFIFRDEWKDGYKSGQRVFSNGDDVGYSFHADFVNGWPVGVFKDILSYGAQCSVGFSLENCPALRPLMQEPGHCKYNGLLVDEVGVPPVQSDEQDLGDDGLPALPGNNPIWNGQGPRAAASYVEKGVFVRVGENSTKIQPPGPGTVYAQIDAGDIHVVTVKGDTGYTGPNLIAGNGATQGVIDAATSQALAATSTGTSSSRAPPALTSASVVGGPVLAVTGASASHTASSPQVPQSTAKTCNRRSRRRLL